MTAAGRVAERGTPPRRLTAALTLHPGAAGSGLRPFVDGALVDESQTPRGDPAEAAASAGSDTPAWQPLEGAGAPRGTSSYWGGRLAPPVPGLPARPPVDGPPGGLPPEPVEPRWAYPMTYPEARSPYRGLVVMIAGLVAAAWPVAHVWGVTGLEVLAATFVIVALVGVRRGKGLAFPGLVLSGLWIVAFFAVAAIPFIARAHHGPVAQTIGAGRPYEQLQVGDCLKTWQSGSDVFFAPVTPCAEPHQAEVYHEYLMTDGAYPGEAAVYDSARARCLSVEPGLVLPDTFATHTLGVVYPIARSWAEGARSIKCLAVSTTGPVTGSVRTTA